MTEKRDYKRSSDILLDIANDKSLKGNIRYRDILDKLGDRAFGIALLFFALPSALPFSFLPGISFVFSIPIAIFAIQIIFAKKTLWLPKFLANRTVSHKSISKMIHKAVPFLKKIEWLLKPRLEFLSSPFMQKINGIMILLLALFLMIPIPFSNFIFAALIIIFALGFVEKDGLFILIGYIGTAVYLAIMSTVIWAAVKAIVGKF